VLWLRDDLTELEVCSIYSIPERWLLIWAWCAGDRRERRSLAQGMRGFHRGKVTIDAKASYCDVVEHLGTWHPIGRRPTPARLSGPAVGKG
jgi:hypothetical protein